MIDAYEAYKRGYEAGYMWGRVDELNGADYDTRTPGERFKEAGAGEEEDVDGQSGSETLGRKCTLYGDRGEAAR